MTKRPDINLTDVLKNTNEHCALRELRVPLNSFNCDILPQPRQWLIVHSRYKNHIQGLQTSPGHRNCVNRECNTDVF